MAPSRALHYVLSALICLVVVSASFIPVLERPRDLANQLETTNPNLPAHHQERSDPSTSSIKSNIHPETHSQRNLQPQSEHTESFKLLSKPSLPQPLPDISKQILRKRSTCGTPGGCNGGDVPVKMGCFPLTGSIIRSVLYGIPRVVKAVAVCLQDHAADPGGPAANGMPGVANGMVGIGFMG
ncbi:MAG: hypothetical protein M1812_004086 [Candelaria pacifica]|nr:MAG: hypothetical protein M1812_004086 [Candelaria pacifica]